MSDLTQYVNTVLRVSPLNVGIPATCFVLLYLIVVFFSFIYSAGLFLECNCCQRLIHR